MSSSCAADESTLDPVLLLNNERCAVQLLDTLTKARQRPNVIIASSSAVYAPSLYGHTEDEPIDACTSVMGATHAFGEMTAQAFHAIHQLDTTVVCTKPGLTVYLLIRLIAAALLRGVRPRVLVAVLALVFRRCDSIISGSSHNILFRILNGDMRDPVPQSDYMHVTDAVAFVKRAIDYGAHNMFVVLFNFFCHDHMSQGTQCWIW